MAINLENNRRNETRTSNRLATEDSRLTRLADYVLNRLINYIHFWRNQLGVNVGVWLWASAIPPHWSASNTKIYRTERERRWRDPPSANKYKNVLTLSSINWFFWLLPSSHICSPVTVDRISLKTSLWGDTLKSRYAGDSSLAITKATDVVQDKKLGNSLIPEAFAARKNNQSATGLPAEQKRPFQKHLFTFSILRQRRLLFFFLFFFPFEISSPGRLPSGFALQFFSCRRWRTRPMNGTEQRGDEEARGRQEKGRKHVLTSPYPSKNRFGSTAFPLSLCVFPVVFQLQSGGCEKKKWCLRPRL